ncbi:MAG: glycosyltransferase family 2 protein [Candidatus Baltobacteraceae bacterium]
MPFDIVVPTIGRASLYDLLDSIARSSGELPGRVIVVDDRRDRREPLSLTRVAPRLRARVSVVAGKAAGPASARNAGWRASDAPHIAFLDDDVRVGEDWLQRAAADARALAGTVAGSQAQLDVPLPPNRAPSDWERNVAGLSRAQWITADMIYRRDVLEQLDGFDERFKRAYREDSDFALRAVKAGFAIVRGSRRAVHPVRPADAWISVRLQAGNADDVLMRMLHGRSWRKAIGAGTGRWPLHLATVLCAAGWAALTAEFALRRIAPGPRTAREIAAMVATSAVIPFAAVYHRARAGAAFAFAQRGAQ